MGLEDLTPDEWNSLSADKANKMKPVESAQDILNQANYEMGDRAVTYDAKDGERSIGKTVRAFQIITGGTALQSEEQGWLFMEILKMVRSQQGAFKMDNYVDAAAYAGLRGESALIERGGE